MEQRLIDANAIKLEKGFFEKIDNVPKFYEWLGKQPTVDAVPVEQIESFIDWLERNGYTLLKKIIIKALHDYRADGKLIVDDLRLVENKQVVAYEYLAGTRVDFTMEDLTDQGRQILLGLKEEVE